MIVDEPSICCLAGAALPEDNDPGIWNFNFASIDEGMTSKQSRGDFFMPREYGFQAGLLYKVVQ